MKAKHIIAAAATAALVIFSGCAGKEKEEEGAELSAPSGVAVEVEEAGVGEMRAEYSITGSVQAASEVNVVPMISGKVETVNVREGDSVSSGQMLFSIDTSTVTATLPSLEASYNATKSATTQAVNNADIGIRNAQDNVEKARRGVNQAIVAYENAQRGVYTAQTGVDQAQQGVTQAQRGVEQARRGVEQAGRAVEQAKLGVEQAQRNVTSAQAGVKNAQISVEQAQTAVNDMYAMYEVGAVSLHDVTTAEQGLEQANLALENANSKVLDAQAGVKNAQSSQSDAQAAYSNAQAAYSNAQSQVTSAQASLRSAQIAKQNAEAGVTSAYNSVADARAGVTSAQRGVESARAAASQAKAQQDASLAQIMTQIDQINSQVELGKVTAPCSGIVTSVNVTAGSMAGSAQPAVVIAENGHVEVQASVAEDVFSKINAGDEVSVLISTIYDEPLTGTVGELPAAINPQTSLYDVSVFINTIDEPQIGAFATVTFYTDENENAIYVPTEAVLTGSDNEKYVFIIRDDCALKVTVETGMVNDTDTEITDGIEAGDLVVVKGQSYLSDGAPAHIVSDDEEENGQNEEEPDRTNDSFIFENPDEGTGDFTPEDAPFKIGTPKDALNK